jgi:hypothetical protein
VCALDRIGARSQAACAKQVAAHQAEIDRLEPEIENREEQNERAVGATEE